MQKASFFNLPKPKQISLRRRIPILRPLTTDNVATEKCKKHWKPENAVKIFQLEKTEVPVDETDMVHCYITI